MSTTVRQLLKSFELLPDAEKREVAFEIIRRAFPSIPKLEEAQLAALYSDSGDDDRKLAEEGIEDYERGLLVEEAE